MAEDAAVRARLQKSGMGALAPATGMQALAATLATSGPAPAVLSAAPIRWEVLLRGKTTPPFFAEVAPSKSLAVTPFKVRLCAFPISPRTCVLTAVCLNWVGLSLLHCLV